jgi:hypothetical protein
VAIVEVVKLLLGNRPLLQLPHVENRVVPAISVLGVARHQDLAGVTDPLQLLRLQSVEAGRAYDRLA